MGIATSKSSILATASRSGARLLTLLTVLILSCATHSQASYESAMRKLNGPHGTPDYKFGETLLRECAWLDDDVRCQLALGRLYSTGFFPNGRASTTITSHITPSLKAEALAWFYLAANNQSVNPGYRTALEKLKLLQSTGSVPIGSTQRSRIVQAARECATLGATFKTGSSIPQFARDRVQYILYSRGAEGLMQLGDINFREFTRQMHPRKWPWPPRPSRPSSLCGNLIIAGTDTDPLPSLNDAYQHYLEASSLGNSFASEIQNILDSNYSKFLNTTAQQPLTTFRTQWIYPGYNFYAKHILTDVSGQRLQHKLSLIPFTQVAPSLRVNVVTTALEHLFGQTIGNNRTKLATAIKDFQKAIGVPQTGNLDTWQQVLIIKTAAMGNPGAPQSISASAAYVLGEMYESGVGLRENFDVALSMFIKAGTHNTTPDPRAFCKLYLAYVDDNHVPKNSTEAEIYRLKMKALKKKVRTSIKDPTCLADSLK